VNAQSSTFRTRNAAWFATALSVALLAGCGHQAAVEARVKGHLKDPDSAKFSQLNISKDGSVGCGFVNAKNSMGGYTGDQFFMLVGEELRTPKEGDGVDASNLISCCLAKVEASNKSPVDTDLAEACAKLQPAVPL
jgi:hypothetical protein